MEIINYLYHPGEFVPYLHLHKSGRSPGRALLHSIQPRIKPAAAPAVQVPARRIHAVRRGDGRPKGADRRGGGGILGAGRERGRRVAGNGEAVDRAPRGTVHGPACTVAGEMTGGPARAVGQAVGRARLGFDGEGRRGGRADEGR